MEFIQLLVLLFIAAMVWQIYSGKVLLPGKKGRRVILDTCALIDGRIVELSKAGFVPDQLIIPEFILHELQLLADGVDAHKRSRARFGLDIVQELQSEEGFTVVIDRTNIPEKHAIDDKLVALSKKIGAPLYTTDYNLNKVAEIEGVKVLNVNELAQHLRPTALPGETKQVKIVQRGSNPKQGAGYMDDGTLIVVEDAAKLVGRTVEVEITKTHQTSAGKMLFGELASPPRTNKKSAEPRLAARRTSGTNSRSLASRLKR